MLVPEMPAPPGGPVFILAAIVFAIALGGCATRTEPVPQVAVPASWTAAAASLAGGPSVAGSPLTQDWIHAFGSAELDALVASAEENNLDVQAADARLHQADARARAAGAAILPQVDFGADSTTYTGHSSSGSAHETDWSALVSASYEVDFWGKNRAARDSAVASQRASDADRAVIALSTVTGVANTYFQAIALREELALAQSTATQARQLLELVVTRSTVGLANPAEVAQQRATVANTEIRIQELQQQESAALQALGILAGRMPDKLSLDAQDLSGLAVPRVSPGLPAELLTRRPDMLSAEESLRAAHADLVQARAAFFPTLTLTGSAGLANPAVNAAVIALSGAGPSLTLGAGLAQSIFDGGRLRAARDEASAKEQEMLVHYRAAALAAMWDVEVALTAIDHLDRQADAQQESLTQSELGLAGARARYGAGSGDFITVLDAERAVISAREQMTQYRLARLQAAVGLCKALGGGWRPG
jgi:outer membrane protein, multidrug efflux system